jgi:hypothetical protein
MENEKTIIEIKGVKMEVDLRTAKVVEAYKIGQNVRVLVKDYGDKYRVCPGVIVSFDDFKKLPTIVVAYLEVNYAGAEIKFASINDSDKEDGVEIAPCNYIEETTFKKETVLGFMEKEILTKKSEIETLERKREYFLKYFDRYFQNREFTVEQQSPTSEDLLFN